MIWQFKNLHHLVILLLEIYPMKIGVMLLAKQSFSEIILIADLCNIENNRNLLNGQHKRPTDITKYPYDVIY